MKKIVRRITVPPAPPQAAVLPAPSPAAPPPQSRVSEPEWTEAPLPLPRSKQLISLRLDPDIIAHFRASGPGWQTRMNAVLRSWVEAQKRRQR